MNCPQCIAATAGFLSAYWLTLAVSLCVALAAVFVFLWYVKSGEWSSGEQAKYEMMQQGE